MKISELQTSIHNDLDSRDLKNPNIRKSALRNILDFISATRTYLNNNEINLPPKKSTFIEEYLNYKKKEILNGAEKSMIKAIYDRCGKSHDPLSVFDRLRSIISPKNKIDNDSNKSEIIDSTETVEVENQLINGTFRLIEDLKDGNLIPHAPGIYCIKLKETTSLPASYDHIPENRIIYIGISKSSLCDRLWEQELNHHKAATFFRSIGAALGYRPEKGSLFGKTTNNYKFNDEDTNEIRKWMRDSLIVNWVKLSEDKLEKVENILIRKYRPIFNIKNNPDKNPDLENARKECLRIAKSL